MRMALLVLATSISLWACREELNPLPPPTDPPLDGIRSACQPPAIEKNIVGTWHFNSNRTSDRTWRTGTVTFTAQNHIIDPDSLFERYIDTGSKQFAIVDKIYSTDGIYSTSVPGYTGKIFRVDLLIRNNEIGTTWPLYVASSECNRIVIYQLASYNQIVAEKIGFTLTR